MKKIIFILLFLVVSFALAWAGDEPPTVESNHGHRPGANPRGLRVDPGGRSPGLFHAGRLRHGGDRIYPGQERHQHHDEKPDGFFHGLPGLLGHRLRPDVRCVRHRLVRDLGLFSERFQIGGDPWVLAFWMFQVVFAATAATIVSGAMAERTKFSGYLIYSF